QIVKYISEQIISGELVEGERIQELRIAKELDVSRGSVREALLLLERTHLIEIFPRRGAIVSEMSAQQVKALFDTNMMLLGHIVQRISETWRAHEADQLQLLLEQLLEHVKAGDIEKFYDAIFQYLAEQQDMVGNPYLMKFYKELLPSLRRSYFLTLNTSKRELQEAFALFKLVTDAILIRKSQQAALFMEDFCRHLRNLVLESLTRMKQIELAWARRSRR
ncbi:GntR family transcriptional regulator, partial [Acinetobacter baumannii]|nr:GntR family transcriptional regulator [Acinetobacter baumannii]NYB19129.1 GntR family transcriptional regulator [Acinetobacter baumannii]